MPAAWPPSLPQAFLLEQWTQGLADNTVRTTVEQGAPKVRRRSTLATRSLAGTMFLTEAQLSALETFFEDTVKGGALRFTFPDPRGGADMDVLFAEPPAWAPVAAASGQRYNVQISLTVLP